MQSMIRSAHDYTAGTLLVLCNQTHALNNYLMGFLQASKDKVVDLTSKSIDSASNLTNQVMFHSVRELESALRIKRDTEEKLTYDQFIQRVHTILKTFYQRYVCRNKIIHKSITQYLVPIYITLRATVSVLKEQMVRVIEKRIESLKIFYAQSKGTMVMFIKGAFNEEKIMEQINGGIQNFKQFTIKFVENGMVIKVDRESFFEHYQQFTEKMHQIVKEIKEISTEKVSTVRIQSQTAYQNVLRKIRQREKAIRITYQLQEEHSE